MTPLGYALLGLLARTPCSGYDLLRKMEDPVGYFWHAQRSQIYPELARLEAAGLVRHTVVEQTDRPHKKVYETTEAGIAALRNWVAVPMKLPFDRDTFMVKVFSLWLVSPQQALHLVRSYRADHAERLAQYEEIGRTMERDWEPAARRFDSPKFASYATLRRGIDYEQGYVSWCDWLAEAIEASAPSESVE